MQQEFTIGKAYYLYLDTPYCDNRLSHKKNEKKREMRINYSRLPIIRKFKGNRKKFELSGVPIIVGKIMENDVRELKITSSSREVRVTRSRLYLGLGFQQCMGFRATVRWTSIKQGCQKKAGRGLSFCWVTVPVKGTGRITVRVMVKVMFWLVSSPTLKQHSLKKAKRWSPIPATTPTRVLLTSIKQPLITLTPSIQRPVSKVQKLFLVKKATMSRLLAQLRSRLGAFFGFQATFHRTVDVKEHYFSGSGLRLALFWLLLWPFCGMYSTVNELQINMDRKSSVEKLRNGMDVSWTLEQEWGCYSYNVTWERKKKFFSSHLLKKREEWR